MRFVVEAVAAVLFVVSTGLLFNARIRASHALFVLVGIMALASSYVVTKHVLDATVGYRMHPRHAVASTPANPSATAPAQSDPFATDAVLASVYTITEGALDRIVRAGTKQSTASVSSDTVVDVIVGLTLAVLGLLSQVFSALFRRLFGADA